MAAGVEPGELDSDKNEEAKKGTYADRLKTNIRYDQRLKRNVLDIELEKLDRENEMVLDQTTVARLLTSIGMKTQGPSCELLGYQIMYGRVVTLAVWCVPGVNLEKFCRNENIQVSRGIWTRNIRPSGRRDVTVTVVGLDFNTPDSLVKDYIEKFGGKSVNQQVIYGRHGEGPLKGVFNGERKYNVEFSDSAIPMGTYHFLDGAKVRVFYRGNTKTCARCQQVSGFCPGEGYAKDCQMNGGIKVDLSEHMKTLWQKVGFKPTNFELPPETVSDIGDKHEGDIAISDEKSFPRQINRPNMQNDDIKKIVGIQVRNFPPEMTEEQVVEFFKEKLDDKISVDDISFLKNEHSLSAAVERGLEGEKIVAATSEIEFKQSKKKFFGKPLYCRLLKNLTPEKTVPPPKPIVHPVEKSGPVLNLQLEKPSNSQVTKSTVKDKTEAFENKPDEKKVRTKTSGQKIAEFGLIHQNSKRNIKEVGSPTSPEVKKSPKKAKAVDKPSK